MKNFHLCKADYEKLKQDIGMRKAAEFYGYPPDRQGRCLCPFHKDSHPSMKIYPHDKGYYCFSCGTGGDVINFISRLYGVGNEEAAVKLIEDFSIPIKTGDLTYREQREREKQIRRHKEMNYFYKCAKTVLSVYRQLLCDAIRDPDSVHFTEAAQELSIVEYEISCLETDLEDYYNDKKAVKKVGEIRERVINWDGGSGTRRTISG